MKRVLALLVALMLAIPGVAFSEDVSIDETVIDDGVVLESVTIDGDPSIDATGLSGDGVGNIDLGGLLDPGLEAGLVSNAPESPAPVGRGRGFHRHGGRGRFPGGGQVERGSG